jgi:hypothetical protein
MQAQTTIKRFHLWKFTVAAVAVGIAASVALTVIISTQSRDAIPATSASQPTARSLTAVEQWMMDSQAVLPDAQPGYVLPEEAIDAQLAADRERERLMTEQMRHLWPMMQFIEQNTILPGDTTSREPRVGTPTDERGTYGR